MQYKIHRLSCPFIPVDEVKVLGPKIGYMPYQTWDKTNTVMESILPLTFSIPVYLQWRTYDTTVI